MEAEGITERDFKDFLGPSFLTPTPPAKRRALLEAKKIAVPQALLDATRPVDTKNGASNGNATGSPKNVVTPAQASKNEAKRAKEEHDAKQARELEEIATRSASSFKGPRTEQP
jgi:hypothetical protein